MRWSAIGWVFAAAVTTVTAGEPPKVDFSYAFATPHRVTDHGTPLYTWCEERGLDAGLAKCTGDRQHLWTPVAVVRVLRDMLVIGSGATVAPGGAGTRWKAPPKGTVEFQATVGT